MATCHRPHNATPRRTRRQWLPRRGKEKIVIASVYLSTVTGEELLTVQAHDLDPYVTVTIRQHSVDLTHDQARRAADALRACALTAIDTEFGNVDNIP